MMLSPKIKLTFAILLLSLPLTSRAQSDLPVLQAGTLTVSGDVAIPETIKEDSIWLYLTISQPFTGRARSYKTPLKANGHFELTVHTETSLSFCAIKTDVNTEHSVTALLKNGGENRISINYNNDAKIDKIALSNILGFTENDLLYATDRFFALQVYKSNKPRVPLYNKSFGAFIDHANNAIQERRKLLNQSPPLSEKMKNIIFRDYTLAMYCTHVFDYHGEMVLNYRNLNDQRMPDSLEIKKPGLSYYSFLKNLDLNNQRYLYCYLFPTFTQELLQDTILNIPRIQNTPIDEWTKSAKQILASLIGFDQGMFYDMLVGNAYAMQFEMEVKPLSPKQVDNIKKYYNGGDQEKILLRRNQEVTEIARLKENLVINNTPEVKPEELMNAIVSRYKGKTVIVDFWATWCIPCLQAFQESRHLKQQLAGKDVVFIYLTNPSSPKHLWEKHIQGIGGQQYYLTKEEWNHLFKQYDFSGVPSYLIFDKNGALKHQFTGYPGNDEMLKKIAMLSGE